MSIFGFRASLLFRETEGSSACSRKMSNKYVLKEFWSLICFPWHRLSLKICLAEEKKVKNSREGETHWSQNFDKYFFSATESPRSFDELFSSRFLRIPSIVFKAFLNWQFRPIKSPQKLRHNNFECGKSITFPRFLTLCTYSLAPEFIWPELLNASRSLEDLAPKTDKIAKWHSFCAPIPEVKNPIIVGCLIGLAWYYRKISRQENFGIVFFYYRNTVERGRELKFSLNLPQRYKTTQSCL